MKEKNYNYLRKAISELPVFASRDDMLWMRIENNMASKSKLADRLPTFKAPGNLWDKVERELNVSKSKTRYFPKSMRTIAATIGILMMLGIGCIVVRRLHKNHADRYEALSTITPANSREEPVSVAVFDPAMCKSNPQVCNTLLFKELNMQWQEVKEELLILEAELQSNDPQLTRYFYRLDDLRIEIEKKMMKLILET